MDDDRPCLFVSSIADNSTRKQMQNKYHLPLTVFFYSSKNFGWIYVIAYYRLDCFNTNNEKAIFLLLMYFFFFFISHVFH